MQIVNLAQEAYSAAEAEAQFTAAATYSTKNVSEKFNALQGLENGTMSLDQYAPAYAAWQDAVKSSDRWKHLMGKAIIQSKQAFENLSNAAAGSTNVKEKQALKLAMDNMNTLRAKVLAFWLDTANA